MAKPPNKPIPPINFKAGDNVLISGRCISVTTYEAHQTVLCAFDSSEGPRYQTLQVAASNVRRA